MGRTRRLDALIEEVQRQRTGLFDPSTSTFRIVRATAVRIAWQARPSLLQGEEPRSALIASAPVEAIERGSSRRGSVSLAERSRCGVLGEAVEPSAVSEA